MSKREYNKVAKQQIQRYLSEKMSLIQALNQFPVAPI